MLTFSGLCLNQKCGEVIFCGPMSRSRANKTPNKCNEPMQDEQEQSKKIIGHGHGPKNLTRSDEAVNVSPTLDSY